RCRPRALGPACPQGEGQDSPFRQARSASADRRMNGWAAMSISSPRAASNGLRTDGGVVAVSGMVGLPFPAAGAVTPFVPLPLSLGCADGAVTPCTPPSGSGLPEGASLSWSWPGSPGCSLGESLGESLGCSLGESLGCSLGESLGCSLGESLGCSLGESLGGSLGE